MSVDVGAGVLVDPPGCTPPRFGLLSVAEVEDRTDGHWELGVNYDLMSCEDLITVEVCPVLPEDKTPSATGWNNATSSPFALVAGYKCSTGGRTRLSEAWDYAGKRLDRGEGRSLERRFWTVDLAGATDVVDLTPEGGAVAITDGLAMLESALGDCSPCNPIIHASRGMGTYLAERHLIGAEGNVMTALGTGSQVAVGGGYPLTGPAGDEPAAGEAWIFGTGSVKILRGSTFFTPDRSDTAASVDRAINDQMVFAERFYAALLDCCKFAVRVNLKSCCC